MTNRILLTGATGTVGSLLVEKLAASDASLRVLVRNPQKAEALEGRSVSVHLGDFDQPQTLVPALDGVNLARDC